MAFSAPLKSQSAGEAGQLLSGCFYNNQAQAYFDRTVGLDLSPLYRPFLAGIPKGGRILDLGCGSGRDSKAFLDGGYEVTPVEPAEEMARLASEYVGQPVFRTTAEWLPNLILMPYDGIWACASLLHVRPMMFSVTLRALVRLLRPGGCLYASLKRAAPQVSTFEVTDDGGRRFLCVNEQYMKALMEVDLQVADYRIWVTPSLDSKVCGPVAWVNLLATRRS